MRRLRLIIADLALLVLTAIAALFIRDNLVFDAERLGNLQPYLAATILAGSAAILVFGLDRSLWRYTSLQDYLRSVYAVTFVVFVATLVTFIFTRLDGIARSIPVLHALLASVGLIGARVLTRLFHAHRGNAQAPHLAERSQGADDQVLIIGLSQVTNLYIKAVEEMRPAGLRIAGVIDPAVLGNNRQIQAVPVFGPNHTIAQAVGELASHGVVVTRLVLATPRHHLPEPMLQELDRAAERDTFAVTSVYEQLATALAPAPRSSHLTTTVEVSTAVDGRDITTLRLPPHVLDAIASRPYWVVKRILDIVGAAILLAALAPVFALVAGLVMITIGQPAIFWQMRPGRFGTKFKLYKFRTMAAPIDAHGRRLSEAERLRAAGRFLRATRLDELPQLWNILIGDMSFIGPRPLLPVDQPVTDSTRLLVKPGLTGWAQVHGGRYITPTDKAALDVWYVMNASFLRDMQIVLQTVPVVLFGERVSRKAIEAAWHDLGRTARMRAPGLAERTSER